MKLFLALIVVVAAVDAKSFFPKKYDETFFDKNVDKEANYYETNDVETDDKPYYYYRYFQPGTYGYRPYSPYFYYGKIFDYLKNKQQDGEDYNKYKPFYPFSYPYYKQQEDTYYDPKEKYDLDTFVKYFTSVPYLAALSKYFPVAGEKKEVTDKTFPYQGYYPVPKEVVEQAKASNDLKDTLRRIVKYYYNLPEDVKATVVQKYDFENVVRFLLQVYYDVPSVGYSLTTYYDIPEAVYTDLRTKYDLKQLVAKIAAKYYELTPFEREYYNQRYFDVPSVLRTLIKVYYGVPQFDKYDVEYYYYDTEFVRRFSEEFVKKYDYADVVDRVFEGRNRLTDFEKEFYDRFFNFDEYLKFLVRSYYYGVFENSKIYEGTPYTRKTFYAFVSKLYKYYYGEYRDFTTESYYPVEYYYNALFSGRGRTDRPYPFYPYAPEYNPYYNNYYGNNKGYYPFYEGKDDEYKGFLATVFGRKYFPFGGRNYYYPNGEDYYYKYFKGGYEYPEEYKGAEERYPFFGKGYYPKEYSGYFPFFNKYYYPKEYKGEFPYYYGGFNKYYNPEEYKGEYYGKDYYYPGYGSYENFFGKKYEGGVAPYNRDFLYNILKKYVADGEYKRYAPFVPPFKYNDVEYYKNPEYYYPKNAEYYPKKTTTDFTPEKYFEKYFFEKYFNKDNKY